MLCAGMKPWWADCRVSGTLVEQRVWLVTTNIFILAEMQRVSETVHIYLDPVD